MYFKDLNTSDLFKCEGHLYSKSTAFLATQLDGNSGPEEIVFRSNTEVHRYDPKRVVPADSFVGTLSANVDNQKLTDAEFREMVRNTLPIVMYTPGRFELYTEQDKGKGPKLAKEKS